MHCPNCGKSAEKEQQFCRACGMRLDTVGKLVAQHAASPVEKQKKLAKAECERVIVRRMINWMIWGMIVLGLGVFLVVLNKSIDLGTWVKFLSSVLILSGVGLAMAGVLGAIKQGASLQQKPSTKEIDATPDEESLPAHLTPVALPSITERTTQLIAVDDMRAKQRDTA
ncbi:MAG TPA: zinc ribbon domain-containing protein [Pyrinomonadaceae bacterium]|nr:zinc ribbon domain-containing protein [Pyrinomonadaceae bacterium]